MNTWAANRVRQGEHRRPLPRRRGRHWPDRRGRSALKDTSEVDIICAGINHQTWYVQVHLQGRGLDRQAARGLREAPGVQQDREGAHRHAAPLRLLLHRVQRPPLASTCPGTASARRRSSKWIDLSVWINGETGGYLRVCTEGRNWFETDFPNWLKAERQAVSRPRHRGTSTAATSSRGWRPGGSTAGTSTSSTTAASPTCPTTAIVEVPGYVDHNGINIPRVGDLPLGCAAVCNASDQRAAPGGRGGRRTATSRCSSRR